MRNIQARILALLLAALMLLGLTACGEEIAGLTENVFSEPWITETAVSEEIPDEPETPEAPEAEADTGTSGSVENYLDGTAIGGDRFGNREGLLPKAAGRSYTECDIDTDGQSSRGAKRLVFSNDGLYFYTEDHYETFDELVVTETQEVAWK